MKRLSLLTAGWLALLNAAPGAPAESLFGGRDLSGWEGDPRLWRVENGVLVGETDKAGRKIKANTFLIWKGNAVTDFDLTLTARVTGGNNSGVQYRSRQLKGDWVLGGYQMDLHPKQDFLSMLYEEKGRGIIARRGEKMEVKPDGKKVKTDTLPVPEVKLSEWNEYRISARGNTLRHFVNGKLAMEVVDREDAKRSASGKIGLQLHAGPPMRLEVKQIRLVRIRGNDGDATNGNSSAE